MAINHQIVSHKKLEAFQYGFEDTQNFHSLLSCFLDLFILIQTIKELFVQTHTKKI